MKRYGQLFERAFTREALLAAFHAAAKHKHARRACFAFERRLGANIDALHAELHSGTYAPRQYYTFMVYEPKPRTIHAPAFRDCVVQHAIYAVAGPIFDCTFIDQSFACRVGRGTHRAADYAQAALQRSAPGSVTLKLDIRKFFYRIDHAVLQRLLERKVRDRRMVALMMLFAPYGAPVGVPIGNLLSQLFALVYLNPLDQFIKRTLKVREYCRYVDDFVCFGLTPARARECRTEIVAFLRDELHLELSKSTLAPRRRGLNFVGYRTWASRRFIRRRSLFTFRRAVRTGHLTAVVSILGHARRTHSLQHLLRTTKEPAHALHRQLPQVYRRADLAHTPAPRGRGDAPATRH
jgi:RNA-directed DNA polymerase